MDTKIIYEEKDFGAHVMILGTFMNFTLVKLCDRQDLPYRVVTRGDFSSLLGKCIIYDSIGYTRLEDAIKKFSSLINEFIA